MNACVVAHDFADERLNLGAGDLFDLGGVVGEKLEVAGGGSGVAPGQAQVILARAAAQAEAPGAHFGLLLIAEDLGGDAGGAWHADDVGPRPAQPGKQGRVADLGGIKLGEVGAEGEADGHGEFGADIASPTGVASFEMDGGVELDSDEFEGAEGGGDLGDWAGAGGIDACGNDQGFLGAEEEGQAAKDDKCDAEQPGVESPGGGLGGAVHGQGYRPGEGGGANRREGSLEGVAIGRREREGRYSGDMTAAIFLDRDDTLMECTGLPAPAPPAKPGDVVDPRLVRVLPGVAQGLSALAEAGFALVVVTNQGVVARGGATCQQVEAVNDRLREALRLEGGPALAGVYYCPFHPVGKVPEFTREHEWRKPRGGMILAASRDLGLDLSRSWMIGDAVRDVEAGIAAGLAATRCVRVGPEGEFGDVLGASRHVLRAIGAVSGGATLTVMMRGVAGASLEDAAVRDTVLASVHGVAERAGVVLHRALVRDGALHVTIEGDRLLGLGLLAEVRRITNRWHEARRGGALWMGTEEDAEG